MTHLTFSDGVSIAMLIFYVVCLPPAIFVCFRHGLARSSGWIFLAIFSIIRIVGCSSELAAISQGPNGTAATVAEVTSALGLSPLLLASLGLTSRLLYSILESPYNVFFSTFLIRFLQTPCIIALVLCILGATSASTPAAIFEQTTLRVGVILFAVALGVLALLNVFAGMRYAKTGRGERPLLLALRVSLPLLVVRIIYTLVECFGSHAPGSVLASTNRAEFLALFLADIEEMAVTVIYIYAGIKLRSVPDAVNGNSRAQDSASRFAYRFQRVGGGRLGRISLAASLMHDALQARKSGSESEETTRWRDGQELGNRVR